MNQRCILITGGAGFIGSNLVKFLINKGARYNIKILDNFSEGRRVETDHDFWVAEQMLVSGKYR